MLPLQWSLFSFYILNHDLHSFARRRPISRGNVPLISSGIFSGFNKDGWSSLMSLQIKHSLQKLQERCGKKKLSSSNKGRQYLQPDLASILHSRDHWDQWTPKPPHVPNKPGQVLYLVVQGTVSWWNCSQDQVSGGRQKNQESVGQSATLTLVSTGKEPTSH